MARSRSISHLIIPAVNCPEVRPDILIEIESRVAYVRKLPEVSIPAMFRELGNTTDRIVNLRKQLEAAERDARAAADRLDSRVTEMWDPVEIRVARAEVTAASIGIPPQAFNPDARG